MTDEVEIPAPPEGYVRSEDRGPFSMHNGPYFQARPAEGAAQAFYVLPRHCNRMGIVHGGMLTSFLDSALAAAVGRQTKTASVTIHLSVDFLSMARAGEWVMAESRVTRATREVVFAEARIHAGEKDIVRGSGVFKLMHRKVE
ncbi:MAG: PaaI family thioesterase [Caulobacteraceae bacterium]|nr:PaaI family thioesterase [Caulobacteraceae bacterium]